MSKVKLFFFVIVFTLLLHRQLILEIQSKDVKSILVSLEDVLRQTRINLQQIKVKYSDDIVDVLKALEPTLTPDELIIAKIFIKILQVPQASALMALTLQKLPEIPPLLQGVREFLERPDAQPLADAFNQVLPPLEYSGARLIQTLIEAFTEAKVKLMTQASNFKDLLHKPETLEAFQKFLSLPEMNKLDAIGQIYGARMFHDLEFLE